MSSSLSLLPDDSLLFTLCDNQPIHSTFNDYLLSLFVEKNSDGTKNLRLKGNELQFRIKKRIRNDDLPIILEFAKGIIPKLVKIDLSYNRIDDMGLKQITKMILSKENIIQQLDLIGCDLRDFAISTLVKCVKTLKLKILRLTGNKIGGKCGGDFYDLLTKTPTLEELDVSDTDQNICSVPHFCAALREDIGKNDTLKILDLSSLIPQSKYYQIQGDDIVSHMSELLKLNKGLIELHLQKCSLDGHCMELLILGLKENKTLQFLDLGFNRISNVGAEKLAEWFKTEPDLVGINLSGNGISEHGARALSVGLPYSKLRLLDLSKNKIPDKNLEQILLTIKKTRKMRLFYIFGNDIGPLSIEVLERHLMAEVYHQENIDFQLFRTPEGLHVAQYPSNQYKQRLYNQLTPKDVQKLRTRKNIIPGIYCENHAKIKFANYPRLHGSKCDMDPAYEPPQLSDEELRERCERREREKAMREKGMPPVSSTMNMNFMGSEHSSGSFLCAERMKPKEVEVVDMKAKLEEFEAKRSRTRSMMAIYAAVFTDGIDVPDDYDDNDLSRWNFQYSNVHF